MTKKIVSRPMSRHRFVEARSMSRFILSGGRSRGFEGVRRKKERKREGKEKIKWTRYRDYDYFANAMKVHRTIGQRIDGRAIWVNIFFTTSFNCLRFASTSLVASFAAVLPRTSRGRPDFFLPFPPPVRSQFSRNDRSKGVERERVDLEKSG